MCCGDGWLLAVDVVGDLLQVAPTKADGGDGGPVGWFGLLKLLFILKSWSKKMLKIKYLW